MSRLQFRQHFLRLCTFCFSFLQFFVEIVYLFLQQTPILLRLFNRRFEPFDAQLHLLLSADVEADFLFQILDNLLIFGRHCLITARGLSLLGIGGYWRFLLLLILRRWIGDIQLRRCLVKLAYYDFRKRSNIPQQGRVPKRDQPLPFFFKILLCPGVLLVHAADCAPLQTQVQLDERLG